MIGSGYLFRRQYTPMPAPPRSSPGGYFGFAITAFATTATLTRCSDVCVAAVASARAQDRK